jgi:SAM-dependent methyltransferase
LSEATTSSSARLASPYSSDFFKTIEREGKAAAEVIVPLAMRLFGPQSVVDVGCGFGEWLAVFQQAGVEQIYGLDGKWVDQAQLAIRPDCFQSTDLTGEWFIPARFDLAVCLEVAEHLPESSSAGLVKRLVEAAPVILFSAAIPGQGGRNHLNEQWPEYWEKLFSQYDYVCLDPFRRYIWQDKRVAWYYQQNLYVYIQRALVESSPILRREFEQKKACSLTLIHPQILRPVRQAGPALKLLPVLLIASFRRRWERLCRTVASR